MSDQALTISELNKYIKDVINAGFPQPVWVCGEIQGYNRNKDKKHIFFELVEKDLEKNEVTARIGLVIFATRKSYIEEILQQSQNAFSLKDDIEVKFAVSVDFYPPHGAVRLIVEDIDPVYTLGRLAQEKQRLIKMLKEKGVLDKNKALELPLVPLNIGLITSDESAAYNDFISELKKSGFHFRVFLRNAIMQGKNCEKDVIKAMNELKKIEKLDAVVITRGGGSSADLACFDSLLIAEAIAAYPLPVLSGIGHEIDISVTDLAAHTYAKTPTAIAKFLIERIGHYLEDLNEKTQTVFDLLKVRFESERQQLRNFALDLQEGTRHYLKDHHEKIIRLSEIICHRPLAAVKEAKKSLAVSKDVLLKNIQARLQQDNLKLKGYTKIVDIAHPANTMKRGFSITRNVDGKLIRKKSDVANGELVRTELTSGIIESKVTKQK